MRGLLTKQIIFGLCIFLLLAASALAVTVNYETTTVSRIVGDDITSMQDQLKKEDFTLEAAGLYSDGYAGDSYTYSIISEQFTDAARNPILRSGLSIWDFSLINSRLQNGKNNLIVINPHRPDQGTPDYTSRGSIGQMVMSDKSNLFVLDSKYAGLHIPKTTTFAGKISSKAAYVAPMSYTSELFVKSFICSMRKDKEIGDIFLNARNNYYTKTTSSSEFLGLGLMSYSLYGKPTLKASLLNDNYDSWKDLCGDYGVNFSQQSVSSEFSISSTSGTYTKTREINKDEQ